MMLRILMAMCLGLLPWELFAEDDMDWADIDAVVEGDRSQEVFESMHYLEAAIGEEAALVGLGEVIEMEIGMDDRVVPDVDQAQRSLDIPLMFEEGEDVEQAQALLARMQHLQAAIAELDEEVRLIDQHEAVRRVERAEFIRYATTEELERLVPDVEDVGLPSVGGQYQVTQERFLFTEMQRRMFGGPSLDAVLGSI